VCYRDRIRSGCHGLSDDYRIEGCWGICSSEQMLFELAGIEVVKALGRSW